MSSISFVVMHHSGEVGVEIAYRDEVRSARVLFNPCKLEVIRNSGTTFAITLLTPEEAQAPRGKPDPELFARRRQLAYEMLADVTCFEADVDVAWVWRAGINDFVRHENTRVTRELLNAAGVP